MAELAHRERPATLGCSGQGDSPEFCRTAGSVPQAHNRSGAPRSETDRSRALSHLPPGHDLEHEEHQRDKLRSGSITAKLSTSLWREQDLAVGGRARVPVTACSRRHQLVIRDAWVLGRDGRRILRSAPHQRSAVGAAD